MASVLGLTIEDPRMVRTARGLVYAHMCVLFIALLSGIMHVILLEVFRNAANEIVYGPGGSRVHRDVPGGFVIGIVTIIFELTLPIALLCLARFAIQGNSLSLMQILCMLDGIGAVCMCFGAISSLMAVSIYQFNERWLDTQVSCVGDTWYGSFGSCDEARRDGVEMYGLAVVISVVCAVLAGFALCGCILATAKASDGMSALQQNLVFTGPPSIPMTVGRSGSHNSEGAVVVGKVVPEPSAPPWAQS